MNTIAELLHKNRNTFGITDPITSMRYPDIISSFIEKRYLDLQDLEYGSIYESKDRCKEYTLMADHRLISEIKRKGETLAIISFQIRYDPLNSKLASGRIYVAIARLYESSRTGKRT